MCAVTVVRIESALLQAYKVGLYGPKIVWIFVGWYSKHFWKTNLDSVSCSESEMILAVDGAIFTGAVFKNPEEERGLANLTGMLCSLFTLCIWHLIEGFRHRYIHFELNYSWTTTRQYMHVRTSTEM